MGSLNSSQGAPQVQSSISPLPETVSVPLSKTHVMLSPSVPLTGSESAKAAAGKSVTTKHSASKMLSTLFFIFSSYLISFCFPCSKTLLCFHNIIKLFSCQDPMQYFSSRPGSKSAPVFSITRGLLRGEKLRFTAPARLSTCAPRRRILCCSGVCREATWFPAGRVSLRCSRSCRGGCRRRWQR